MLFNEEVREQGLQDMVSPMLPLDYLHGNARICKNWRTVRPAALQL